MVMNLKNFTFLVAYLCISAILLFLSQHLLEGVYMYDQESLPTASPVKLPAHLQPKLKKLHGPGVTLHYEPFWCDRVGVEDQSQRVPHMKPSFMIIGTARATAPLFRQLQAHPNIYQPVKKELQFWGNLNLYNITLAQYEQLFPCPPPASHPVHDYMTLDATPRYLFTMTAADIAALERWAPGVKHIVVLRDPVKRLYSHFNHLVRFGHWKGALPHSLVDKWKTVLEQNQNGDWTLPTDRIPKVFDELVRHRVRMIKRVPEAEIGLHTQTQIVAAGIYSVLLKRWLQVIPKSRLLFLHYDDLVLHPKETLQRVFTFLNLPPRKLPVIKRVAPSYPPMMAETSLFLQEFYRPYNEELYSMLGENFRWNPNITVVNTTSSVINTRT